MALLAALVGAITITAPWPNGGTIPRRYTCDGADATPKISWVYGGAGSPGATSAALELVDVDAPGGRFVHWLRLDRTDGRNTFGRIGWRGPCPPPGDRPHRYVLTVYQLDRKVRLPRGFGEAAFLRAVRGHVAARGTLVGRYGR